MSRLELSHNIGDIIGTRNASKQVIAKVTLKFSLFYFPRRGSVRTGIISLKSAYYFRGDIKAQLPGLQGISFNLSGLNDFFFISMSYEQSSISLGRLQQLTRVNLYFLCYKPFILFCRLHQHDSGTFPPSGM